MLNLDLLLYTQGSLAASLITEKLILGRCHSKKKSLAVILMTFGIIMFTYASSKQVQEENHILDWIAGIILLSTSLVLSARMGIYQEQIYSKYGRHHKEALFFTVIKLKFPIDRSNSHKKIAPRLSWEDSFS